MSKRQMIKAIDEKIADLDEQDHESIIWWNKFRKWVKDFKAEPVKRKPMEERKAVFLEELKGFQDKYDSNMLNAFWKYWTEHNTNGKLMRFEMSKNQPFNMGRRLGTWKRLQIERNKGNDTRIDKFQQAWDNDFGSGLDGSEE